MVRDASLLTMKPSRLALRALRPRLSAGRSARRAGKSCCVTYLLLPLKLLNFSEMRISENCESFQWRESFCDAAGQKRGTRRARARYLRKMAGTLPPSLLELRRTSRFARPTRAPSGSESLAAGNHLQQDMVPRRDLASILLQFDRALDLPHGDARQGRRRRAVIDRPHRGLRPVVNADLAQNRLDMNLHRRLGDVDLARYRLVRMPLGQTAQDAILPRRELRHVALAPVQHDA